LNKNWETSVDQESGVYYNHFRYYAPKSGRYITSDPVGLYGGMNTYSYAGQNPFRWFDFFGLTANCPKSAPTVGSSWIAYEGNSIVFHCGYDGYLENRTPTVDDPRAECFYDECGNLVDNNHKYPQCGGTP